MTGRRIAHAIARRADLRYPFPRDFAERLDGRRVAAVRRRAKYLLVDLDSGDVLLMHLGMSGSFRVERATRAERPPAPAATPARRRTAASIARETAAQYYWDHASLAAHDHVIFEMTDGTTVVFNDPRRFGFMKLLTPQGLADERALAALGPEPLEPTFTPAALASGLAGRKISIKVALLDQRVVSGIGNIYACEALHRARLSPKRRAATLVARSGAPKPDVARLVQALRDALEHAIAHDHRGGGEDRFRVYDREGERCPRRGCGGTIMRMVQAGRSTFYCPRCQK